MVSLSTDKRSSCQSSGSPQWNGKRDQNNHEKDLEIVIPAYKTPQRECNLLNAWDEHPPDLILDET